MLNIWGPGTRRGRRPATWPGWSGPGATWGPMTDGAYVNFLENEGRAGCARRLPHPDPAAPGSDQGALRPDQLLPDQPEHPPRAAGAGVLSGLMSSERVSRPGTVRLRPSVAAAGGSWVGGGVGDAVQARKAEHLFLTASSDVNARTGAGWAGVRAAARGPPRGRPGRGRPLGDVPGPAPGAPLVIAGMTGGTARPRR